ncbi:MAG: dihydroorotase [Thermoplasmataceae archaeon]|jgi:dihydroorotase
MDRIFTGRFYFRGKFDELDVAVSDGKIQRIGKSLTGAPKTKLWKPAIPSGFDSHVHFREPGESESEDYRTGSMSAVYGGTTTVLDMPNNLIPIRDYERFRNKLAIASGKSFCDFGLYSLFDGRNLPVIDRDSCGLKIFLGGSTNSLPISDESDSLLLLKDYEKPVVFHGESASCLSRHLLAEVKNLKEHDLSRPEECEMESANLLAKHSFRSPVMTHISSPKTLDLLPADFATETTPHHLLLNNDMDLGPYGKCNPPLRTRQTQEALLQAFLDGRIHAVSSDHAPHPEERKGEFQYASSGIIGVETRIPLLLGLVAKKILPLDIMIRTSSSNPAKKFGLKKGMIEEGYYADFMTFDLSEIKRIKPEKLHSKNSITPFSGFEAVFPSSVILRGEFALQDGEIIEDPTGAFTSDLIRENP